MYSSTLNSHFVSNFPHVSQTHSIRIQHVQWLPPLRFQSILINESLNGQSFQALNTDLMRISTATLSKLSSRF